jgi:hypothetical protein
LLLLLLLQWLGRRGDRAEAAWAVLLLAVGGWRRRRWRQSRHVLRPWSHHSWLLLRLAHHSQRLLLLLRMPHSHHHLLLLLLLHLHALHHLLLLLCPRDKCARAGWAHLRAARGDRPLHMHHTLARPLMLLLLLLLLLAQHSLLRHLLLLLLSRHHHTAGRHSRLPHKLLPLYQMSIFA